MTPDTGACDSDKRIANVNSDLTNIIPKYIVDRREDIHAIEIALRKNDYTTIKALAQNMKKSGTEHGFERISTIGKMLEQAAVDRNNATIATELDDFIIYLDKIQYASGN